MKLSSASLNVKAPPPLLPQMVYAELRSAILNGAFRPGEMLRQEDIASRLGVSRGPLREVLPKLEADGLVTLYPRRGYAVTLLDPEDIVELFELRALLEKSLVGMAVRNCSDADLEAIRALNNQAKPLAAADHSDRRVAWSDLNVAFHQRLLAASGKRYHLQMHQSLCLKLEPYIRVEITLTGDLDNAQAEHDALVEAFAARDVDKAVELTEQHIRHTEQRLLQQLRASGLVTAATSSIRRRALFPATHE